ncbi:MAG TPA: TIGR03619 family F420-dependent LLM class oxidoreductase [Aquihabitans sp.]|nr:TIGR03619 family F420-dependent LLM class oxidoreductase [Aquihabitans sp.]
MKVRIGFGLGTQTLGGEGPSFASLVDALEELRFDSLWLSDRLTGHAPDPLTALAFAAGRTERLKLGTSVLVLPGRNPVVLAKEMASLDRLSDGRFLPAVGLGAADPVEHGAFGVARAERSPWFDEALGLMRRLWTEDRVTHEGERFTVRDLTIRPKPVQAPLEVWLGGQAPSELRRVGRVGDGWLPSFCTVADVAEGWPVVTASAAEQGRSIDPEHLGALVAYARTEVPDPVRALLARRRPGLDPRDVVPVGLGSLRHRLEELVAVGASKFVVLPLEEPDDWHAEVSAVADAVGDLQT